MKKSMISKRLVLSFALSVLVTLASFRYIFPIGSVYIGKGELYSISIINPAILAYFLIVFIVIFIASFLIKKKI